MVGVVELTMPALFAAGLAASPHCALMCGPLNAAQLQTRGDLNWREAQLLANGGRIFGYATLGALAGGVGSLLLPSLPAVQTGPWIQALAALLLIVAGLRHLRQPKSKPACCLRVPRLGRLPLRLRLFAQGMLWAALPCAILYGIVLLAAFSASAAYGAFLMAAFGLGTSPLLWASGELVQRLAQRQPRRALRLSTGAVLVTLGLISAMAVLGAPAEWLLWCRAPA
jgi:sulfite exporter TauE/SafE